MKAALVMTALLGCAGVLIGLSGMSGSSEGVTGEPRPAATSLSATRPVQHSEQPSHDGGVAGVVGPDVVLSEILSVSSYGPIGDTYAYSLGSHTCNIGDQNLLWLSNGTPGFGMNAYRLYDGRLVQIGMSWVKHACCVVNSNSPGICGTVCQAGGTGLRIGCLDVYDAGWNANQSRMGPRSGIDAYSGQFSPLSGTGSNAVARRLQVHQSEMNAATYPGALYFAEGVYVGSDDAAAGNWLNNASYKRITFSGSFQMQLTSEMHATIPAIFAWREYGNGVGQPDEDVNIIPVDVPGEGRFYAGSRVNDNGDGTWRYEYALYNLNSHRSGGGFSLPLPDGVNVTGVGFHSPPYHSGEPLSNSPWVSSVGSGDISWSSPQNFSQNPNSNALRWGTMYNFWFDADQPPTSGEAVLGLFRPADPGMPDSVTFTLPVPSEPTIVCAADLNDSGAVDVQDLLILLAAWGPNPGHPADLSGSGAVGVQDLLILLAAWGPCE